MKLYWYIFLEIQILLYPCIIYAFTHELVMLKILILGYLESKCFTLIEAMTFQLCVIPFIA